MKILSTLILLITIISVADSVAADRKAVPEPKEKPGSAVADKPQAANSSSVKEIKANPVTSAFVGKGVKSCALRIQQVSDFLIAGGKAGGNLYSPGDNPDKKLATASLEIVDKENRTAYVSTSFAPNQANGCGAVYDAVVWNPKSCDKIAETEYAGKKIIGKLRENIRIIQLEENAKVFLLPTEDGCVTIKKELVS